VIKANVQFRMFAPAISGIFPQRCNDTRVVFPKRVRM